LLFGIYFFFIAINFLIRIKPSIDIYIFVYTWTCLHLYMWLHPPCIHGRGKPGACPNSFLLFIYLSIHTVCIYLLKKITLFRYTSSHLFDEHFLLAFTDVGIPGRVLILFYCRSIYRYICIYLSICIYIYIYIYIGICICIYCFPSIYMNTPSVHSQASEALGVFSSWTCALPRWTNWQMSAIAWWVHIRIYKYLWRWIYRCA